MIQLLPSSYNQTRNVMMNYEVLANIYKSRRGHKLDEWRDFCKWIEELPYSELIMNAGGLMIIQLTPYRELLEIVAKVIFIKEKRRIKFMNFTVMQLIIMFLIAYVCLYALIDRVMKCIEHCATARAYGRFKEAGIMTKMDDVAAGIAKSKEEKENAEKRLN